MNDTKEDARVIAWTTLLTPLIALFICTRDRYNLCPGSEVFAKERIEIIGCQTNRARVPSNKKGPREQWGRVF